MCGLSAHASPTRSPAWREAYISLLNQSLPSAFKYKTIVLVREGFICL